MSQRGTETEALVARLSHRPENLIQAMITIGDPPGPLVTLHTQDRLSSVGALDRLPTEILQELLNHLDVRSLLRFSQTCYRANGLVGSLSSYRNLLNHAPDALAALSRTKIIHWHSISQLHTVLRSPRCETCPGYGAFLFLPTCDRVCWQCLQFRKERLVVLRVIAGKALGLTEEDQKLLPLMRTIPGRYGIRQLEYDQTISPNLVAVVHAMELAISRYGSWERVRETLSEQVTTGKGGFSSKQLQALLRSDDYFDADLVPRRGTSLVGRYFGRASILFPSLTRSDQVEYGHWCRGCKWISDQRDPTIDQIVDDHANPYRELLRMERTAYSLDEFLRHIEHCHGAQTLLSGPSEEG